MVETAKLIEVMMVAIIVLQIIAIVLVTLINIKIWPTAEEEHEELTVKEDHEGKAENQESTLTDQQEEVSEYSDHQYKNLIKPNNILFGSLPGQDKIVDSSQIRKTLPNNIL